MMRQRSRRACDPCRKRKVKCNGKYPCEVCTGYGYECSFPDESEKLKKKPHAEKAAVEASHVETLAPALIQALPSNASPALIQTLPSNASHASAPSSAPSATLASTAHTLTERGEDDNWSCYMEVPNNKDLRLSSFPFPESLISRFTTVYSSVAFPRELGQSLDMPNAPRLHPFAWNTGTREERLPHLGNRIFDQITLQDTLHHAKTYFEVVHPIFALLDQTHFTRVCITAWSLRQMPVDLEAAVCSVVVLGSLFSNSTWSMESRIADQASHLLNISTSFPPSQLSLKFVVAWLLRAIYLRCTTRPHLSWIATCSAMHVAEAIGLHQEFGKMNVLRSRPREVAMKEAAARRKTFWIALSLNKLFSVEYGRTPVKLDSITCATLDKDDKHSTVAFVNLCQLIPRHSEKELGGLLQSIAEFEINQPPLALLKADLVFMVFRKMRFLHMPLSIVQQEQILCTMRSGLAEARLLSSHRLAWWNIISVPFQSIAVLIAMNSTISLSMLGMAVEALKVTVSAYDTHLAREALQTADELLRGFQSKKVMETGVLSHILEGIGPSRVNKHADFGLPLGVDWPSEDDGSWMEVFMNLGDQYSS